jgi:threonine dehydratase
MKLAEVLAARRRIAPYIRRTPLVESPWLSSLTGAQVRLKLESLQVTSSFKARGALNAVLARLEAVSRHAGDTGPIVTASAGNHGRALAFAAERFGIRLIVFTPHHAPRAKLEEIRRHGAELRADAESYEEAERLAKAFAADERITYISPYSHPDVIAGAATIALEILEDWSEVGTILVPVGGGGLVSGIGAAARAVSGRIEVIGVEAEASPAFHTSLAAGRITEVEVRPTIADGLAGNMDPETITFDYVRRFVSRMVLAPERAIEDAVRGLASYEHLIAEGAGATAVAALVNGLRTGTQQVAVVVSGSNIDAPRLASLLIGGGAGPGTGPGPGS